MGLQTLEYAALSRVFRYNDTVVTTALAGRRAATRGAL
jgi:hypothetical protein